MDFHQGVLTYYVKMMFETLFLITKLTMHDSNAPKLFRHYCDMILTPFKGTADFPCSVLGITLHCKPNVTAQWLALRSVWKDTGFVPGSKTNYPD
jgi:hypothetical protein